MNATAIAQEALSRAQGSASTANYSAIFAGFEAKGIPASDILPRENVLTFHAWKAIGRSVRKGEHGVRVCTWIPMTKKDAQGEAHPIGKKPRSTTVFHISQTDAIGERAEWNPANTEQAVSTEQQRNTARSIHAQAAALQDAGYYSDEFTPMGGK